ncbi:DUF5979 domain-containing protein [Xylanimonas oleitrophica]|nr:DUF5979 domain-containing protein [Xylanimonas oleitrophica]
MQRRARAGAGAARWRRWRRRWTAAVAAVTAAVLAAPLAAGVAPAWAADAAQYLEVSKRVDASVVEAGSVFTYTIGVTCSEQACVDAVLTDELPEGLQGFAVNAVNATTAVPRQVTWTEDGRPVGQPSVVGARTAVRVTFTEPMPAGATFTLTITLQVPEDLGPRDEVITNTARTTATNSAPDEKSVDVRLRVPVSLDVDLAKVWEPAQRSFEEGAPSTVTLTATNASNTALDTLVVTEPRGLRAGAATLEPANPFALTDLASVSTDLPAGADSVRLDAYVHDGTSWAWVEGVPAGQATLPAGVRPADVGGLRLTYAGAVAPGATATARLGLVQRAADRAGDDLSRDRHEVENVAEAVGEHAGATATGTARATHVVVPAKVAVDVVGDLAPALVSAGEAVRARVSATNTSDVPVRHLTVTDQGWFVDGIHLAAFRSLAWPDGATSAEVVYELADGGRHTQTLAPGQAPAEVPAGATGFVLTFTGSIPAGAGTTFELDVATDESATGATAEREARHTVTATVVAPNGQDASADASDTLVLRRPALAATLTRTVRPSSAVEPGTRVVVELESSVEGTSEYARARTMVVEDRWDTREGSFWDGFDVAGVSSTQVPSGASLLVEAFGPDGTPLSLGTWGPEPQPFLVSLTADQVAQALPPGTDRRDLTGIRFTLTNAGGFAVDQTFTPYLVAQARGTLRSGGPVTAQPGAVTVLTGTATLHATGVTPAGTALTAEAESTAHARVVRHEGEGGVGIETSWRDVTVTAQSGQLRATDVDWRVGEGYGEVTLSHPAADPAGTPVAQTVFDAFDLVRIEPVGADTTPYSNGWYLRYDTVTAVELFVDGAWHEVTPPQGGWVQGGRFVGHVLTPQERAGATGVRLVLAENRAAREAALVDGPALDPYAPLPGTGVAAGATDRRFSLMWEVRNTRRSDGEFVTPASDLGGGDPGTAATTARITAVPAGGGAAATAADSATIVLDDQPPGVRVTKSATPGGPVHVPREGSGAPQPVITYGATASSTSVSRASYVRITDPAPCAEVTENRCQSGGDHGGALGDPFAADVDWLRPGGVESPFERLDVTAVQAAASRPGEVDLAASTAWVVRYAAGAPAAQRYVTERTTIADLVTWTPQRLADVVGVSVTFQGPHPEEHGGTISAANDLQLTLQTTVRTHVRSTGEPVEMRAGQTVDTVNRAFAQSYDPVLAPTTRTGDVAGASLVLTGGTIDVLPRKQVSPDVLTAPARTAPVTVTLGAQSSVDPLATLAPAEVWLRDDVTSSPQFWDAFTFTGLGTLTAPAGADRVTVDVYGPWGPDGEAGWTASAPVPVAAAAVPVPAERYGDVQGVRVTFSRADGAFFSSVVPSPAWSASAAFTATLRETHRTSGDPVLMTGTVENTVTVRSDRRTGEASPERTATASLSLTEGTRQVAVRKVANEGTRTVSVGSAVPWDLTFTNRGTGYLTVTELRDTLPATLVHTGDPAPVYSTSAGGSLSTDVTLGVDGRDLVLTWPQDGRTMSPGETFTVRLFLELQPGLRTGERATNTMTVRTAEQLAACTGISGAATTTAWTTDRTTCGTTDYVSPVSGPNLYSVKGVRGSVPGAVNPAHPDAACSPTLQVAGGSYYRAPCVAGSTVGGTDDWVLHVVNAGTVPVDELVLFEQLPTGGDRLLLTGASRASTYRPLLTAAPQVDAPPGTTVTLEVTTSPDVCVGTWRTLTTQAVCEQNGETWTVASGGTDWAAVTGLRVSLDFRTTAARQLASGGAVSVTYSTVNRMESPAAAGGVSPVVPRTGDVAWNQFGAKWRYTGESGYERFAPSQVGVQLPTGAVRVDKQVTGAAAGYAPDTFRADVACTVDGVELDLGPAATVVLGAADGLSARVDGIPLGAVCTVTEHGGVGEHGETTRTGSPATVTVATETPADGEVPATQVVTLGNDYAFSGLSVTKRVDTAAGPAGLDAFPFALTCTSALGTAVTFDDDGTTRLEFTLRDGETFAAPAGTVPARATCLVTETTDDAPRDVVVTGDGVTDHGDGSALVAVGSAPAEVTFTNGYDAGVVRVVKEADGAGATAYGTGPFGFEIACTRRGDSVLEQRFTLDAGAHRSFGPFVTGTRCAVTETATGGATRTALSPTDGTVVVDAPDAGQSVSEAVVTVTNTFDVGDLEIVKTLRGTGVPLYGAGPFEAQVACTWQVDGRTVPVALPADGRVTLAAATGYRALLPGLPLGAECTVTETRTGGVPGSGDPARVIIGDGPPAEATFDGTVELASLQVTKRVDGHLAAVPDAPFRLLLACTWDVDGTAVPLAVPGGSVRDLRPDQTVTFADLPAGADCTVTETGTAGAAGTVMVVRADGRQVGATDGTSAGVTLGGLPGGPEAVEVVVTNTFAAPAGGAQDGGQSPGGRPGSGTGGDGAGGPDADGARSAGDRADVDSAPGAAGAVAAVVGWLPRTGAAGGAVLLALLLVGAGTMLLVVRRRRAG